MILRCSGESYLVVEWALTGIAIVSISKEIMALFIRIILLSGSDIGIRIHRNHSIVTETGGQQNRRAGNIQPLQTVADAKPWQVS
jgi:hypothetical protein